MPHLSIVVPCYNEQESLPGTARVLGEKVAALVGAGIITAESSVTFVDDGSADNTWRVIEFLCDSQPQFHGIKLAANRGHQNALLAGLLTVAGDVVISMDADLQDDPAAIDEMLGQHGAGYDIVYGVRADRSSDSWAKRTSAELYYRLLRLFGVRLVFNHADFRLMSRRAIEALREYPEVNLFLRGIVPQLGFSSTEVHYVRQPRLVGDTKYPLRRMLGFALQGITSFSAVPLRWIAAVGLLLSFLSLGVGVWSMYVRLFTDNAIPGWASTVVPIYFLGGVQLFAIGIIGEYVGNIYAETKRRPRFIVEKKI